MVVSGEILEAHPEFSIVILAQSQCLLVRLAHSLPFWSAGMRRNTLGDELGSVVAWKEFVLRERERERERVMMLMMTMMMVMTFEAIIRGDRGTSNLMAL